MNKLQTELESLETTLNERKQLINQLKSDIKDANIEGLTLSPLEDQNGNILAEDENRPPLNDDSNNENSRFNVRLGSTRRCLKISEDGELAVGSGFWV